MILCQINCHFWSLLSVQSIQKVCSLHFYHAIIHKHKYSLMGCLQGLVINISWKYGLQIAKTILWACNNFPSQANVTSTRSPRSNKFWKPVLKLSWKLFQQRANSSSILIDLSIQFQFFIFTTNFCVFFILLVEQVETTEYKLSNDFTLRQTTLPH